MELKKSVRRKLVLSEEGNIPIESVKLFQGYAIGIYLRFSADMSNEGEKGRLITEMMMES